MQQKRISISINPQVKLQLEQLAEANYRTLNGEIKKAIDFYILSQANGIEVKKETFTTPTNVMEASIEPQTEVVEPQSVSICTNNNQYDEVEEF